MLLRTEVEEVRAALYLLFWVAALGDGDGVVGDFRAADACWPPGVDDAQRVCTSLVSAWLIRKDFAKPSPGEAPHGDGDRQQLR